MKKRNRNKIDWFVLPLIASSLANAEPHIDSHEGDLQNGNTIKLLGSGFSDKINDQPLLVWQADDGLLPNRLGRRHQWSTDFNGEIATNIVARNSSQSIRFDHGSGSSAALAGVDFNSNNLFVHRVSYEDFDVTKDYAIRVRFTDLRGSVNQGQMATGSISGATGVIQFVINVEGFDTLLFHDEGGSINRNSPVDFVYGELITTDTGSVVNSEGSAQYPTGTFRTFNFKTMRMWNKEYRNNALIGSGYPSRRYNVTPEYTDNTLNLTHTVRGPEQRPFQWKSDELYYSASGINIRDGEVGYRINNEKFYEHRFITRNLDRPGKYDIIYQTQVSNGARPESNIYYDLVYIDDTWHHVSICDEPNWETCRNKSIQVPISWEDSQIEVVFNSRQFDIGTNLYFFVVDQNGEANQSGYEICPKCPAKLNLTIP